MKYPYKYIYYNEPIYVNKKPVLTWVKILSLLKQYYPSSYIIPKYKSWYEPHIIVETNNNEQYIKIEKNMNNIIGYWLKKYNNIDKNAFIFYIKKLDFRIIDELRLKFMNSIEY